MVVWMEDLWYDYSYYFVLPSEFLGRSPQGFRCCCSHRRHLQRALGIWISGGLEKRFLAMDGPSSDRSRQANLDLATKAESRVL